MFAPNDTLLHSSDKKVRIALLYAFAGLVWILFADTAISWLAKDLYQIEQQAVLKWMFFVIVAAGVSYLLLRNYTGLLRSIPKPFLPDERDTNILAYYDRETGLPNHNLLLDRLNQIIAFNSRKRKQSAVIYIGLTGCKDVVDASGGGEVIRGIAERLVSKLRHYDTVSRIHRDEFVLVLGGTVLEGDVTVILNKLLAVFSEPLRIGTNETIVPACFGIACFPADGATSESLLHNAHVAMKQARQNNMTIQYYSDALQQKATERLIIETGLLRAMEERELFLCYQPKMDINGMDIIGMEALGLEGCEQGYPAVFIRKMEY